MSEFWQQRTVYPRTFSGARAVQMESEFLDLLALLRDDVKPKSYLEVGVGRGDTFHEISTVLGIDFAAAVDLPNGRWGFKDGQKQIAAAVNDMRIRGIDVETIFGDSRSTEVIDRAALFAPYDFVLIDGDHTYEGVKADFDNYGKLGRVVAFHDIKAVAGVQKLWDEVSPNYKHIEFIDTENPVGIGVLWTR